MSAFLQYLVAGLAVGCGFALVASGLVTIHRVTRVVNFAQGMFAVVAGLTAGSFLSAGLPHIAAEVAAVLTAGAAGLVVGLVTIGRRGTGLQAALIITLGLGFLAYAVEVMIWGDGPRSHAGLTGSVTLGGAVIRTQAFLVVAVAAVVFAALWFFFNRTYTGKALAACSSDPYAARIVGIDVTRMGLLAFVLGGMLGGIAGVLLTPMLPISYNSDVLLITNGFAAAVLGGLDRPGLALIGALTLGVAESLVAGYYDASYQTVVALALMLAIMIWQASRRTALHHEEGVAAPVSRAPGGRTARRTAGRTDTSRAGAGAGAGAGARARAVSVVVAVVAAAVPLVLPESQVSVYVLLLLAVIVVIGLSMLMGLAGQVSLGQASFTLTGGYTAALIALHGGPGWLGLLAAPVVAVVLAVLIGIPLLRLRGHQLAFATLAVQLILLSIVGKQEWTGGDIGLQGVPRLRLAGYEFADAASYAYLALAALGLVVLVTHNVITSRPGRGLRALATSEVAAASSGVPVARYKLTVFALSAGFAGLAGGIYAFYIGYVAPGSFPVLLSFEYVVMVVVGGAGSIRGALLGTTVITLLLQSLNTLGTAEGMPAAAPTVLSYAVYGALLVLVMLFLPQGLVAGPFTGRSRKAAAEGGSETDAEGGQRDANALQPAG